MPDKRDCLDCGQCENCIDRAMDYAEEAEMQMECPYCLDGWVDAGGIAVECGECGGTGWY